MPPKIWPTSMRSRGSFQSDAIALALSDFPQPCTPSIRIPFGSRESVVSRLLAKSNSSLLHPVLEQIQATNIGKSVGRPVVLQNRGLPDDLLFFRQTTPTSNRCFSTSDLAKTFSASVAVSPWAAFRICSRSSWPRFVSTCGLARTDWIIESRSSSRSSSPEARSQRR